MGNISIKVESVSKQYRLGLIGTGTLNHDINRWWANIRGKEDPYLKIGETNDRSKKGSSDYVWALKDIDFEVEQGEVLGIIGKNGAGKSTLLKILSRVTGPSTGKVMAKGRIGALLEVGTGFHPELTGKENIYLNGAILGMKKHEINSRIDEIIEFSGCERYIDTPAKRYSSGMTVRLGFAVAAFLEPEVLIVDEVLAVGDAEFQKKAIGKMKDVSQSEGKTVLFVSHNMASVKSLCSKAMILENGLLKTIGETDDMIRQYLGGNIDSLNYKSLDYHYEGFSIKDLGVRNEQSNFADSIIRDQKILIEFNYINETLDENIYWNLKIKDEEGNYLITTSSRHHANYVTQGIGKATMVVPPDFFNEGSFSIDLMVLSKNRSDYRSYYSDTDVLMIQILPEARPPGSWLGKEVGSIRHKFEWI